MTASSPTLLVQRAAAGDSDAMRALFSTLYPDIKRLARSRLAQAGGVTGLNATALNVRIQRRKQRAHRVGITGGGALNE